MGMYQSAFNQALGSFAALGALKGIKKTITTEAQGLREAIMDRDIAQAQERTEAVNEQQAASQSVTEALNRATELGGPTESSAFEGGESTGIFTDVATQKAFEAYTNKITEIARQRNTVKDRVEMINELHKEGYISRTAARGAINKLGGNK